MIIKQIVIPRSTSRARNRWEAFISSYYSPNIEIFAVNFCFSECKPHLFDLENLPDDLNNDRDQDTKNDHRGDREIKFEVFFFNSDISRQPADPV